MRENDEGARHHYAQARRALAHRIHAVEGLAANEPDLSSTCAATDLLGPLANEDVSLQHELSRFEAALGRGAKRGFLRGPQQKLKFTLEHDKRLREHYDRTRPGVDAAIFQTLKYGMTVPFSASF